MTQGAFDKYAAISGTCWPLWPLSYSITNHDIFRCFLSIWVTSDLTWHVIIISLNGWMSRGDCRGERHRSIWKEFWRNDENFDSAPFINVTRERFLLFIVLAGEFGISTWPDSIWDRHCFGHRFTIFEIDERWRMLPLHGTPHRCHLQIRSDLEKQTWLMSYLFVSEIRIPTRSIFSEIKIKQIDGAL